MPSATTGIQVGGAERSSRSLLRILFYLPPKEPH